MTTVNDTLKTAAAEPADDYSEVTRLLASVQDAMTDDIVNRLSAAVSEGVTLLDRLTRNTGLMRLLQVLDQPESQTLLIAFSDALRATSRELAPLPPSRGGIGPMVDIMRSPDAQEGMRIMSLLGRHLSESLREQHRLGGKSADF